MPVSHYRHINAILSRIDRVKDAKSYLDVGIGFGKYGVLLRERYEARFKRCIKEDWACQIDGVEICDTYITPYHRYIYDNIYTMDIRRLLKNLTNYDIIIALEILEHLPKEDAISVAKKLYAKTNKLAIFSFPRTFNGREGSDWKHINPAEQHLCLMTPEDLDQSIGTVERLTPTIFAKEKPC